MTVMRAIGIMDLWDKEITRDKWTGKYLDWTDVDPKKYKKVLGDSAYHYQATIVELFKRYKSKELHAQILMLADNLPLEDMPAKRRKEITNGLDRVRNGIT